MSNIGTFSPGDVSAELSDSSLELLDAASPNSSADAGDKPSNPNSPSNHKAFTDEEKHNTSTGSHERESKYNNGEEDDVIDSSSSQSNHADPTANHATPSREDSGTNNVDANSVQLRVVSNDIVEIYLDDKGKRKPVRRGAGRNRPSTAPSARPPVIKLPRSARTKSTVAGYITPKAQRNNGDPKHHQKALQLQGMPKLLRRKLKDPLFLEACFLTGKFIFFKRIVGLMDSSLAALLRVCVRVCFEVAWHFCCLCIDPGVKPEELQPKSRDHFRTEKNRCTPLPQHVQEMRFNDFEADRLRLLEVVVAQEEECYVEKMQEEEGEAKTYKRLQDEFESMLQRQNKATATSRANFRKLRSMLDAENSTITTRLRSSKSRAGTATKKVKRLQTAKARSKRGLKMDGETKKVLARRRIMEEQAKFEAKQAEKRDRLQAKEARFQQFLKTKAEKDTSNKQRDALKAMYRKQELRLAKERAAHQRKMTERLREAKDVHAKGVKEEHHEKRQQYIARQKIKMEALRRTAARQRLAAENRRIKQAELRAKKDRERQHLYDMRLALQERQKEIRRIDKIEEDEWRSKRVVERLKTPGPGEYAMPDAFQKPTRGGRFGRSRRDVDLHWDWFVSFLVFSLMASVC